MAKTRIRIRQFLYMLIEIYSILIIGCSVIVILWTVIHFLLNTIDPHAD